MAKIIVESRQFTDRNTGISTNYEYYAVSGKAMDGNVYEVQLKNLVQSEKVALQMLAGGVKEQGEVRVAKGGEVESKRSTDNNLLDDDEKGLFD